MSENKINKITDEHRRMVIKYMHNESYSVKEVNSILRVPYKTAVKILTVYAKEGIVQKRKQEVVYEEK